MLPTICLYPQSGSYEITYFKTFSTFLSYLWGVIERYLAVAFNRTNKTEICKVSLYLGLKKYFLCLLYKSTQRELMWTDMETDWEKERERGCAWAQLYSCNIGRKIVKRCNVVCVWERERAEMCYKGNRKGVCVQTKINNSVTSLCKNSPLWQTF